MEARIKKLEVSVDRLRRRAVKVSTGFITPYPISMAKSGSNIQGEILTYMFPCAGVISKGAIKFGEKPKGNIEIGIEITDVIGSGTAIKMSADKQLNVVDINLKVKEFDCLKVYLYSDPNTDHPVTRVWATFLWKPTMSDIEAKSFLIDELDKIREVE